MTKNLPSNSWKFLRFLIIFIPTTLGFYLIKNESQKISNLTNIPVFESVAVAQTSTRVLQQGSEIVLNGRKHLVPWMQWQEGNTVKLGFSDTAISQLFGLDLLNSKQPDQQAFTWFSPNRRQTFQTKTRLTNSYRYLDLTDFLQQNQVITTVQGNILNINTQPSQITNITVNRYGEGGRIVVDLDRPGFWQLSQNHSEGVVLLEGNTPSQFLQQFPPPPPIPEIPKDQEADNPQIDKTKPKLPFLILENANSQTKLKFSHPIGYGVQVWTVTNPNRMIIDVRPDPFTEREIQWHSGIIWRNSWIRLGSDQFPVTWLEVDLKNSRLSLKPIVSNQNTLIGTAPLLTTARNLQPLAAINGGFFNRNNQLPLGAIRQDNIWLSSPILNRGAIAWNNQGQVKISRLRLDEFLITNTGQRLPILFLNSGYVQAGLARYTPSWGSHYTPLSDRETLVLVQNNQVINVISAGAVGQGDFPIPPQGYLLTIRNNPNLIQHLPVNTRVNLQSATIPSDLNNYPHILGAGPVLLQNRQIVVDAISEQFSDAFNKQAASRSAIATNSQGKVIIAAIHNRSGGKGPTLTELAKILQLLGAVDGLNLDGGSSTSLYLGGQLIDRSPVTAARVHNGLGLFVQPSP
jgi:hypothetical protein